MSKPTYTLEEATETIDNLVKEFTSLLSVAARDMPDVYDDDSISVAQFDSNPEGGQIMPTRAAKRFARLLVEHLIFTDEVSLDYVAPSTPESETTT